MNHIKRQAGISLLSMLCYGVTIGVLVLAGTKILPSYYDGEFLVTKGLVALSEKPELEDMSRGQMRAELQKYFSLNNVRGEPLQGIDIFRQDSVVYATVDYEIRNNIFANVDVIMHYQYQLNTQTKECCELIVEKIAE